MKNYVGCIVNGFVTALSISTHHIFHYLVLNRLKQYIRFRDEHQNTERRNQLAYKNRQTRAMQCEKSKCGISNLKKKQISALSTLDIQPVTTEQHNLLHILYQCTRQQLKFSGIFQSNFIMKCDKRTQNIESSVRMTVQKNIKKQNT